MAPAKPFDLRIEVDTYVNRLDNNLLLNGEETDELRDHFHCQVEELSELGLSEAEAFEVSKMRFGERQLIQTEFHKAKPMKIIYRYLMVGLLLLFSLELIEALIAYCSAFMFILIDQLHVSFQTASIIDLGIKGSLLVSLSFCIYFRLKRGTISKWLLWFIPVMSIVAQLTVPALFNFGMSYDSSVYFSIAGKAIMNSKIIMVISYLLSVGLFFVLWHRNGKSLRLSN